MDSHTISNLLGVFALTALVVIALVFAICAIIDFTRGVEDPIGSLADEEREREREEGEARVWCKYDPSRHCVDCEICAGEKEGGAE